MLQARLSFLLLLLIAPITAAAQLTPEQASAHIGETTTVCGIVVSAHYAATTKRQPTFLNYGRPYPNQTLSVLIWGKDRPKFNSPETRLVGKRVCVIGLLQLYRGKPEIIVTDPLQLVEQ